MLPLLVIQFDCNFNCNFCYIIEYCFRFIYNYYQQDLCVSSFFFDALIKHLCDYFYLKEKKRIQRLSKLGFCNFRVIYYFEKYVELYLYN